MNRRDELLKSNFDGYMKTTGIICTHIEDGCAKGEIEITSIHLNPMGTIHGGVHFTLADTIGGLAAISRGMKCTTVSSEIVYLNPSMNVKKIFAESKELKHGKRMSIVETLITDENDVKLSKVTSVYYYLNENGKAV